MSCLLSTHRLSENAAESLKLCTQLVLERAIFSILPFNSIFFRKDVYVHLMSLSSRKGSLLLLPFTAWFCHQTPRGGRPPEKGGLRRVRCLMSSLKSHDTTDLTWSLSLYWPCISDLRNKRNFSTKIQKHNWELNTVLSEQELANIHVIRRDAQAMPSTPKVSIPEDVNCANWQFMKETVS